MVQENVVQTRNQANNFKSRVHPDKEKEKISVPESTKQQPVHHPVVSQSKQPPHMTYNVVDELTKIWITLPLMEVVKIPQQRDNILNILDGTISPSPKIEVVVINTKQQKKNSIPARPRGKAPPF
jgi:hypothetical protein